MVGLMIGSLWTGYSAMKDDAHRLPPPRLMASNKAYIEKCDETDGVKDGIVSDPEPCSYDPGIIQCKEGDQNDCLTVPQVEALRDIYGGTKNPRTGELVFPGFPPGSEQLLTALTSGPEPFQVATSYFRDVVFNDPEWDFKSFDYDKDLKAAYEAGSDILDVPSDGLSRFFRGGGKLLLSHGWADGLIPAPNTIEFYKSMIETMDPKKAADSVRLFMLPGVSHCAGGNGPSRVDMLSVIDIWASEGKAPDSIIASRLPNQEPMTRPICPYPQVPVYKGSGSTDDAASFVCELK
jgi:feruloyl esterase